MSPYSPLKAAHGVRIWDLKDGSPIAPTHVQLIISDLCNQDCGFCAYRMSGYDTNELFSLDSLAAVGTNNPIRKIPHEKVTEILDSCFDMDVRAIQLTGGGEPSIHPNFPEICESILNRNMDLAVVSNGTKLLRAKESLLKASWVRVSVDAANADSYSAIRRVGREGFFKVIKNIEELCSSKIGKDPLIGFGFVVTKENWTEILAAAELAKSIGADNFRISAVFQTDNSSYFDKFYSNAQELCRMARELEDESFKVFDLFGDRIADLEQESPDYVNCAYQHFCTYIGGDLNVYRCCNTAYNNRGLLGSIKDVKFDNFWWSPETQEKLTSFDARSCSRCQFNAKNKVINYLLSDNPDHVNFV